MKINKLLVISLAASFVLASCSKDNEPKKKIENKGDTYSSLTLRLPSTSGTRAVVQNDDPGSPAESAVAKITLNSSKDPQKEWSEFVNTKPADYGTATDKQFWKVTEKPLVYTVSAFLTKTGTKDLGLILNKTTDPIMNEAPSKDLIYGDGTVKEATLKDVIQDNNFTMTSEAQSFNAVGGVKKEQANDQTNPKNLCEFKSVERLVAKVELAMEGEDLPQSGAIAKAEETGTVESNNLSFAVQGSQTQVYLYNNNAGGSKGRQIGSDNQYEGLNPAPITQLVYTGDGNISANTKVGGTSVYAAQYLTAKKYKYFLPTATFKKAMAKWGEVAYVTVYAKFKPSKYNIWYSKFTEKADGTKWVAVNTSGEVNKDAIVYNVNNVQPDKKPSDMQPGDPKYSPNWNGTDDKTLSGYEWKRGEYVNEARFVKADDLGKGDYADFSVPTDGTFYVVKGKQNSHFFLSKKDAVKILKAKEENVYTYKEGKMGYRVLINRVLAADNKTIVNCDTRRNNWYKLKLTGITGLGFNYDKLNPQDPNLPKPEEDPDTPIDEITPETPVNNTETFMRFEATILPWNVVSRDVTLDL